MKKIEEVQTASENNPFRNESENIKVFENFTFSSGSNCNSKK
jgi:hypothetical protein